MNAVEIIIMATKKFRKYDGTTYEADREVKILKLISIHNTDYYKGKNHDDFTFVDYDGNYYHYHASLNADMTEYDSDIAKKLAFGEGEYFKISAYFIPHYDVSHFMYLPRFVK